MIRQYGKDITIFITLIIAGSVLVALPTGAGINITGFFMIFAGLLLALFLKTGYKDEATGKAYLQLFEYVPHRYDPCSDMYEYDLARVEKLIK